MPLMTSSMTALKASTWKEICALKDPDSIQVKRVSPKLPAAGRRKKTQRERRKESPTATQAKQPAFLRPSRVPKKMFSAVPKRGIRGIKRRKLICSINDFRFEILNSIQNSQFKIKNLFFYHFSSCISRGSRVWRWRNTEMMIANRSEEHTSELQSQSN